MSKSLFIAEKPSVAREFAAALKYHMKSKDGFLESEEAIVTWCVGHLVTMSYPEVYDEKYRRWSFDTLPFMPHEYRYEVIENVRKQFGIVSSLLNRPDVDMIYVCTDSGREGEYIYRLVEQMSGVQGKVRKRVWIDSQTEEEILRGIREAKDLSEYDNLSNAAYLRAKADYLMGINFSRVLTLKYGWTIKDYLKRNKAVVSVGRVMTCVQGMIVDREREIRVFVKTPFYRVLGTFGLGEKKITGEWKAVEGSRYYASPALYKDTGFLRREDAEQMIDYLSQEPVGEAHLESIEKKTEKKNPPLLYNLAELQNDCSKYFKISPDETLRIVQELYERKMVTYPRTDARVLSTAVAKEIHKNLSGLRGYAQVGTYAAEVLQNGSFRGLSKTRYVNDKQITDHYAIIPTGQGLNSLAGLPPTAQKVYEIIARRFLSIFYPPAVYQKFALCVAVKEERFFANFKVLTEEGYLKVAAFSFKKTSGKEGTSAKDTGSTQEEDHLNSSGEEQGGADTQDVRDEEFLALLKTLKKGAQLTPDSYQVKEGETSPPKRYTSGSIILAMENAGQLIEDVELRAQIKGSGIGTSATRAEILKKLIHIEYLDLNKKTQVLTPTLMGEMVYDVVRGSIRSLLNPSLTASWEKGLTLVTEGNITSEEYMEKLTAFVGGKTTAVKQLNNQSALNAQFHAAARHYSASGKESGSKRSTGRKKD